MKEERRDRAPQLKSIVGLKRKKVDRCNGSILGCLDLDKKTTIFVAYCVALL